MNRRRRYHPFTGRNPRSLFTGLRHVLARRGLELRRGKSRSQGELVVAVPGDGPEVRMTLSAGSVPRLGRVLLMETSLPKLLPCARLAQLTYFTNEQNERLLGAKLYLRPMGDRNELVQVVVERCALLGSGDLFRLADELDLLVLEYGMSHETLVDRFGFDEEVLEDPIAQARQIGLFDGPPAGEC
jgi:hypothetical protein